MNRKKTIRLLNKAEHRAKIQPCKVFQKAVIENEYQIVGVKGGVIEPTEINVKVFSDAIKSVSRKGGVSVHQPKISFSEEEYGEAWTIAKDKVGNIVPSH